MRLPAAAGAVAEIAEERGVPVPGGAALPF
jgi:hypothetical protein